MASFRRRVSLLATKRKRWPNAYRAVAEGEELPKVPVGLPDELGQISRALVGAVEG